MRFFIPLLPLLGACLTAMGCAPSSSDLTPTCSIVMTDKKDLVGQETHESKCDCACPKQRTNVFEFGGILGGLANLVDK